MCKCTNKKKKKRDYVTRLCQDQLDDNQKPTTTTRSHYTRFNVNIIQMPAFIINMTRLGSVDAALTRALEQEKREEKGLFGLPFFFP